MTLKSRSVLTPSCCCCIYLLGYVRPAAKYIELGLQAYEKAVTFTAGTFSFGNNLTIADLCLIPQLFNARRYGVDLAQFPTITRIEESCAALPAFVAAHPDAQPDNPDKK